MYNSLKRQNRIHGPTRRTISCTPAKSGRETSIAASDESMLNAISNTIRKGKPIYFVRTDDGVTLDVVLSKTDAIAIRDAAQNRLNTSRTRVRAYERLHTALIPVG